MAYYNKGKSSGKGKKVMISLTLLITLVVALFAYSEVLDAVMDGVCPTATPYYLADATTAGRVCCINDATTAAACTLLGGVNISGTNNMFGDTVYLFINNIVPVFAIVGIFGALYYLLKTLRN